jgi:hypothetical protein
MAKEVQTILDAQIARKLPATVGFSPINVADVADDDGMNWGIQIAKSAKRFHQHGHALIRRQPANK